MPEQLSLNIIDEKDKEIERLRTELAKYKLTLELLKQFHENMNELLGSPKND